jgi:ubiquinone/menaquinone biosynthesis C-methylase UbiE
MEVTKGPHEYTCDSANRSPRGAACTGWQARGDVNLSADRLHTDRVVVGRRPESGSNAWILLIDCRAMRTVPKAPLSSGAFDELADAYDASFTATALGACLRTMVWRRLDETFAGCRRILELGCGTGEDAVYLASRGFEVLATDVSSPMLRAAERKARQAGFADVIEFRPLPMERLASGLRGEMFDGVFSNFGAVNCVPQLDGVAADLARMLEPGAPLFWVVMGRHVPWEWAWFLARGEWRKAFRRGHEGGAQWHDIQISYPTPAMLERALRPYFEPVSRRALGSVLPPTYASAWLERSPRTLQVLARLERALQDWQALATLADHYIFEARRVAHADAA